MAQVRETFNTLIARNKRNSVILIVVMTLLLVAIGAVIGGLMQEPLTGIIIALVVTGVMLLFTWSAGSGTLLSMAGASELAKEDDPQLYNVVEEMAIAAGVPMPKIYFIDTPAMNAFATGISPDKASVAITRGLRERLTREELQGVMAHEIGHIRNFDIRYTLLMVVMAGAIVLLCDFFLRSLFWSGGRRRSNDNNNNGNAQIVLLAVGILLAILAPLIAALIRMALSRQREYLADASAVEFTRNPNGLASALTKLGGDTTPMEANKGMESMYIVSPAVSQRMGLDSAFSTHPPIAKRIQRLRQLQGV